MTTDKRQRTIDSLHKRQFNTRTPKQILDRFQGPGGWLFLLAVAVAMLLWNWKLLLATSTGIAMMALVYSMQEWDWQRLRSRWQQLFGGSNRQLALAVASGSVAALSTYMTVAIWVDADRDWTVAGGILQGLGTLAILMLLAWQAIARPQRETETELDRLLAELTRADPLRRLIAVRKLRRSLTRARADGEHRQIVADSLHLMLCAETEPIVRNAALESLQALDNSEKLTTSSKSLFIPMALQSSAAKIGRE